MAERARREHGFGAAILGHAHVLADHVGRDAFFFELHVEAAAARLAGVVDRLTAERGR
jgi:hypothetical protein